MNTDTADYLCIGDCRCGPDGRCLGCGRPVSGSKGDYPSTGDNNSNDEKPEPVTPLSD